MKKILILIGTRPEAIKMAMVYKEFKKQNKKYITKVCITAQHREMLDQVINFFSIKVDYDLNLMEKNQNLYNLTAKIIDNLKIVYDDFNPDLVFVHGDTTTTFAGALTAFYNKSLICHVEAGLRTNDKYSPYPEEINRQLTTKLTDYHFAPTELSKENLISEKILQENILVTGNTVIDSLFFTIKKLENSLTTKIKSIRKKINDDDLILVTVHRRENHGKRLLQIIDAISIIAQRKPKIKIVIPVHLNPKIFNPIKSKLTYIKNIILIEPLEYYDFVWLMNRSKIILTDSGGVQEEAPSLGKPVLVLRDKTERPEAVDSGNIKMVGSSKIKIIKESVKLLENKKYYNLFSKKNNPYGDGNSSTKIVKFINKILSK